MKDVKQFIDDYQINSQDAFIMMVGDNEKGVIFFKDIDSKITHVNKNFFRKHKQFIGHENDIIGKTDFDLFPNAIDHATQAFHDEQNIIKTGEPINIIESEGKTKDGRTIIAHTRKYPLRNRDGEIIGIFGVTEDLTDDIQTLQNKEKRNASLLKMNEKLSKETIIDALSELYNRRYLRAKFEFLHEQFQKLHREYSIIILDIDDFKYYNDAIGHSEGDKVIHFIGQQLLALKDSLKKEIDPCRYGGDEFLVILPDYKKEEALQVAKLIKDNFHRVQQNHDFVKEIHFSMGVGEIEKDETISQLINRVDEYLYNIKRNGKNNIGFQD